MRIRSALVLLFAAILVSPPSIAADVYKTVDEDGNVTFTDSPPKDKRAEKIELKETNTQPPVEFRSRRSDGREGPEEETGPYNPRIVSPENEYQMGPREASLAITVETDRPLDDEHSFQLFVNGVADAEPTQSSTLTLANVRRGRKDITVSIVDSQGTVIASSNAVSIYVIRPNPKPLL